MKVLGLAGWSGSGKTTLLTALIPLFKASGITVSSIKLAHHDISPDQPGKDSWRHAQAGAAEVILASKQGFSLFSRAGPVGLEALLARLAPVDLVLVEGMKAGELPKLEIYRPALGKPPLWPDHAVLAVASDAELPGCPVPVLNLADPVAITHFLIARLGLNVSSSVEESLT